MSLFNLRIIYLHFYLCLSAEPCHGNWYCLLNGIFCDKRNVYAFFNVVKVFLKWKRTLNAEYAYCSTATSSITLPRPNICTCHSKLFPLIRPAICVEMACHHFWHGPSSECRCDAIENTGVCKRQTTWRGGEIIVENSMNYAHFCVRKTISVFTYIRSDYATPCGWTVFALIEYAALSLSLGVFVLQLNLWID